MTILNCHQVLDMGTPLSKTALEFVFLQGKITKPITKTVPNVSGSSFNKGFSEIRGRQRGKLLFFGGGLILRNWVRGRECKLWWN